MWKITNEEMRAFEDHLDRKIKVKELRDTLDYLEKELKLLNKIKAITEKELESLTKKVA